jgi:hypothetical protein
MLRRYASTALLTGSLMFGLLSTAVTPSTLRANAVGVLATVHAIDAQGTATLMTDGGEKFTVRKVSLWKVGTRLQCERVADTTPHYVQHCQLWQ